MPKASSFSRFTRGVKHTVKAFASTRHPVLVHIVPMRRCNLACTYCNEFDKTSDPVPIDVMLQRIDKLAEFGSSVITISGGEPMMHPEIYEIIARIRHHGMIAGLISNGYYFQPEKVKKLNEAGLVARLDRTEVGPQVEGDGTWPMPPPYVPIWGIPPA